MIMNTKFLLNQLFAICGFVLVSILFPCQAGAQSNSLQVYVANQGNFSDANGSVSQYTPEDGVVIQDVVAGLNTLVQSMTVYKGVGYILGNTSDKIDIVDLSNNARIAQIGDVSSPRFMKIVSDEKAYVSNLFSASVTVLDLENLSIQGTIPVGMNPESIALVNGRAYVSNFGFGTSDSTLSVIDVITDTVIETKDPDCDGPRFLEVDREDELWVFCNGKTVYNEDFTEIIEQTDGQVVVFDGISGEEVTRIELDEQAGASSLGQDAWFDAVTNQMFLVLGNSIAVFDAANNELSNTIEISGEESIGAVAYEPNSGSLYLARITGFTSAGFVSIHNNSGTEVGRFVTGVAPAFIAFYDPFASNTAVEELDNASNFQFHLRSAYPNPVSVATSIPFVVDSITRLSLRIYNALGQEVALLVDDIVFPGQYSIEWEANVPAGIYFYQLSSSERVETKMLSLVK